MISISFIGYFPACQYPRKLLIINRKRCYSPPPHHRSLSNMASLLPNSSATIPTTRSESETKALFEEWLVKQSKSYKSPSEKEERFSIFKDNLQYIDQHNSGNHSFQLGLNVFADLTKEEYRSTFLGGCLRPEEADQIHNSDDAADAPPELGSAK